MVKKKKNFSSIAACALLSAGLALTTIPAAHATPSDAPEMNSKQISQVANEKIGTPEWDRDIDKLINQGRLKVTDRKTDTKGLTTTYEVIDPENSQSVGSFSVFEPFSPRIGGKMKGFKPAIIFNQTDQKALQAGGTAAVAAMASGWAAALSETVVGSILSAGAISFIGGVAAVYVGQHGVCPGNKDLVVTIAKDAHCE